MNSKSLSCRPTSASSSSCSSSALTASGDSRKRSRNPDTRSDLRPKRKSPFTDFGSYMLEKNRKLQAQFQADASVSSGHAKYNEDKGIFHGVSIYVDGFTVPSSQELREYMLKHGGRFENYLSRHTVTHIICSNLPDSKIRNLRAFSHGIPVVRPEWVVDCLAANRLMSCVHYQVGGLERGTCKQQKLSTYFHPQGNSSCKDAKSIINHGAEINVGPNHLVVSSECQTSEPSGSSGQVKKDLPRLKSEESSVERGASNLLHSTLTDPNFVDNYFKSSRLHFIGTWRNGYRKHFSTLITGAKSSNKFGGHLTKQKAAIIHIDMDCFFVSVIIRNHPHLLDKPVAVCHSNNPRGTAEISSANYVARDYGVRAGMFVRDARVCCHRLVILPYDFEAYEEVAEQFYNILHKHCNKVQALSCDEAFLDVTECGIDPQEIASIIRKEIAEATRCTASAGIAENLLLARLATKSAKPNGQRIIPSDKVEDYLNDLPIIELPGIGYSTCEKLKSQQIQTCGQMRMLSKESLQMDFGIKTGDMLWSYCRGIDNRNVEGLQVLASWVRVRDRHYLTHKSKTQTRSEIAHLWNEKEAKSVGAEVNWGVRFNNTTDCHQFLMSICKEVSLRLNGCGVQGRTVTLKVKKRKEGATEPVKFMGCGDCDNMSRSITVPVATDNVAALQRIAKKIFSSFHIDAKEVRGMGLQVSKLESVDITRKGYEDNALQLWLSSSVDEKRKYCKQITWSDKHDDGEFSLLNMKPQSRVRDESNQQDHGSSMLLYSDSGYPRPAEEDPGCVNSCEMRASALPRFCDLDIDVVKNLPTHIFLEMDDLYEGKLSHFIRYSKKKDSYIDACSSSVSLRNESINDLDTCMAGEHVGSIDTGSKDKGKQPTSELCRKVFTPYTMKQILPFCAALKKSGERTCLKNEAGSNSCARLCDLQITTNMKSKFAHLSQADPLVLVEQPADVKDIRDLLPVHRELRLLEDSNGVDFPRSVQSSNPHYLKTNLWLGSPPSWVTKFRISNNNLLNAIAVSFSQSGKHVLVSAILLSAAPILSSISESSSEAYDAALSSLHELLVQYIDLKIGSDIEELYNCFCFLKRLSSASKLLMHVYNGTLPIFQASLSENYGGRSCLSAIHEPSMEE